MFERSLGAGSFAAFWRYWNPMFGYYLGRYVYVPLKQWLPSAIALVITFVICGALHDAVTIVVRGSLTFFFTPWFFVMGAGVVISQTMKFEYSRYAWPVRALINISYIAVSLALVIIL